MIAAWKAFMTYAQGWSTGAAVLRLSLAVLSGVVIGVDRGRKGRGAGIKTYAMVCLGAALVMLTSQYMVVAFPDAKADMARMGAQVISGVGFLGVGTIMITGNNQVRGLTTAAGLWTCACIGLAIGIGYVEGALFAVVMVLLVLKVLTRVDEWLRRNARVFDLYIEFENNHDVSGFVRQMHRMGIKIVNIEMAKSRIKGEGPNAVVNISLKKGMERSFALEDLRNIDGVIYLEEL